MDNVKRSDTFNGSAHVSRNYSIFCSLFFFFAAHLLFWCCRQLKNDRWITGPKFPPGKFGRRRRFVVGKCRQRRHEAVGGGATSHSLRLLAATHSDRNWRGPPRSKIGLHSNSTASKTNNFLAFFFFFSRDIISIFIISPVTVQIIIIGASRNRNNDSSFVFCHGQGEREKKIAKRCKKGRDQTTGGHKTHTYWAALHKQMK